MRQNIQKIKHWFYTDECVNLLPTNPLSKEFWKAVPSISHVVSQQIDHDDTKTYYDADRDGQPDIPESERVTRVTGNLFVKKHVKKPVIEEIVESENEDDDEEMRNNEDSFSMTSLHNSLSEASSNSERSDVDLEEEGPIEGIAENRKRLHEKYLKMTHQKYLLAIQEKIDAVDERQKPNYQFVYDNLASFPSLDTFPSKSVQKYMMKLYKEFQSDMKIKKK